MLSGWVGWRRGGGGVGSVANFDWPVKVSSKPFFFWGGGGDLSCSIFFGVSLRQTVWICRYPLFS